MNRLFDANVFIEAKNRYYGFDICPGFWDWMDSVFSNGAGTIDKIWAEISGSGDELSEWAKARKAGSQILQVSDKETQEAFAKIANHVQTQGYKPGAVSDFLSGADPWLIAKATVINAKIVTHEVLDLNSKKKVPIPNICKVFGVNYENTFDALRGLKASFSWKSP